MAGWVGTGIAPPATPSPPLPRVHPPTRHRYMAPSRTRHGVHNMVVGLRSVAQLTLEVDISGSRGITEVYNLLTAGIISNHYLIPGNN